MNIVKKQWMAPVATEIEVNNGGSPGLEGSYFFS